MQTITITDTSTIMRFSTLQCGSWIDAGHPVVEKHQLVRVSVPFNAGRGLMLQNMLQSWTTNSVSVPFNAGRGLMPELPNDLREYYLGFSTLQCGSWIDA